MHSLIYLLDLFDRATQIPGLTNYIGGLVSSLATLEAPSATLAATEGIGLAALGLGKDVHIDLLYKSQVGETARVFDVFSVSNACAQAILSRYTRSSPTAGFWAYGLADIDWFRKQAVLYRVREAWKYDKWYALSRYVFKSRCFTRRANHWDLFQKLIYSLAVT